MNRISKEDLEKIFENHKNTKDDENLKKGEDVLIHKATNKHTEEISLKKVRRGILKISRKKIERGIFLEKILKITMFFGFTGFIFFIIINLPAYKTQFDWLYYVEYLGQQLPSGTNTNDLKPTPTPTVTVVSQQKIDLPPLSLETKGSEGRIVISKINVTAPIIWNVAENDILNNLESGVVHYKGTSLPGEGGNVFIVGHSSNYIWAKGDYNQVFALLDKLSNGDRIQIIYGGKTYYYEVISSQVVSPNDVGVLSSTPKEILTLLTCYPVGTSLNRLIVQAQLQYSAGY